MKYEHAERKTCCWRHLWADAFRMLFIIGATYAAVMSSRQNQNQ